MKNNTILAVDDTVTNLDILGELLSDYTVMDTTSGKDALKILDDEKIDLILLDIMMPEMDGFEVCKIIKENPKTKDIPIIFITADTNRESIQKAYEVGGTDYITKPFIPNELLLRIKKEFELIRIHKNDNITLSKFNIDPDAKVIIEYDGKLTQDLIMNYMEEMEDSIENINIISNLSTIFSEQAQNIIKYAKSEDINCTYIVPNGYVNIQQYSESVYTISSKNIVSLRDKEKIEPRINEVQALDRAAIRKRYRELRKSGENTHEKGGGIGFYEIAKRCSSVEYKFEYINEDRFYFYFTSILEPKK